MLARAFADPAAPAPAVDGARAASLARVLDLPARILWRTGPDVLRGELGEEPARDLLVEGATALLSAMKLEALAGVVAGAAHAASVPIVFLKGVALLLGKHTPAGGRRCADVDVLVDADRAPELSAALTSRGFRFAEEGMCEHQLPPLGRDPGEVVEIHLFVPSVRLDPRSRRNATAGDLHRSGLLRPIACLPASAALPAREVLVAHALAHGIAQHGLAPESYPFSRMLADLADLDATSPGGVEDARRWVAGEVSEAEVVAAVSLVRELSAGMRASKVLAEGGGAALLLAHVIAGSVDQAYQRSLKLRAASGWLATSELPRPLAFLRLVRDTLFLSPARVEAIYGPQRGRGAVLLRQVARPFDVAWRTVRALVARAALACRPARRRE